MKKILFLIQNLGGGGSERIAVTLINNLENKNYKKTLIILENHGIFQSEIESDILKVIYKNLFKNRSVNFILNFIKALFYIYKNKQNIVFSQYIPGKLFSFFIPFLPKQTDYIYREINLPLEMKKISRRSNRILDTFFYKFGISNYSSIVVQSIDMKEKLIELSPQITQKIILINNPIDCKVIDKKINESIKIMNEKNKLNLISVGRLNQQKGYDLLIRSLMKIKNINYELKILEIGKEEENLLKLIKENNLEKKIKLIGFKKNPYIYMKEADFFISSSRFEGFPNAVLEANYCGIPVIANNYKGGINEIIENGVNGEIIDITDSGQLRNALLKKYNSLEIKKRIKEKYDVNIIIKKYEEIF